ncbi:amidase [Testicularia cyperi]|uniref:amidase n=1 Tax=Testicularia cyperi TaxID=1882483 RepID=A0A317Y0C4_9BASI|nr:amidase [Testicularia cyperi]
MSAWQEVVEAKRARREALIPAEYKVSAEHLPPVDTRSVIDFAPKTGIMSSREVEITDTDDVKLLLQRLASGEYKAAEVLEAFIKRTCIAHQVVNPLTEIHFDDARRWAAELDKELETTGKPRGPLHGLPISVKDQFKIKGSDATIAYVSYANKPADTDSVLIALLKQAGAVPFVKTNLPQTIMYAETNNELWGTTLNPHNRTLHAGGSSGGEGALVAFKGSPLGVGTDIGGSVRIPAALCGLFGLRPSNHRFPYEGAANSLVGQITIPSVLGPLSRSLSGLVAFSKGVLSQCPWLLDPQTPSMPWSEERYQQARSQKKLNIGVMWNDGMVRPFPPYTRAMKEVLAKMSAQHDIVDFEPYDTQSMLEILGGAFAADGGKDIEAAIAPLKEPLGPNVSGVGQAELPGHAQWLLNKRKLDFQKTCLDHWNATASRTKDGRPIDILIVPGGTYTALPHKSDLNINYTGIFNVTDNPVVVLPITKVDQDKDAKPTSAPAEFFSDEDKKWFEYYDPSKLVNAPVGIQVVGRRYEEEAILGFAEQVWNTWSAS